jgi:type III restriction enzyme
MELKNYQKEVLSDLESYLSLLDKNATPSEAFSAYWTEKWIARPLNYIDRVPSVPYVSLKVPTWGGKTLLAVHSIGKLVEQIPVGSPRVVLWFVPWDTILTQTLKAFRDVDHPYRRRLDEMFGGRVSVYDKEAVISGAGFSASSVLEITSVIVLSMQSFRSKNKEGRKAFEQNGNLHSFSGKYESGIEIDWADELSLIKILHNLNPVIVVDESHRAETDLSREMLTNLNPRSILGLTATPHDDANIISYVDAIKLKKEQMVKLPVVAYNLPSRETVIETAVQLQKNLEKRAEELSASGGKYIRPIVLFQAESRTREEAVNYDRIKEKLIEAGIPANQIAIKVSDKDEIKSHDLLSRDCPIRFIITVDALKEGWDCSFAYILASLANRTSTMNVTQILGRVLRQPYARSTIDPRLNLSYVLSSSDDFHTTIQEIIKGLNTIGFWKEDIKYENLDTVNPDITPEMQRMAMDFGQALPSNSNIHTDDSPEDFSFTGGTLAETSESGIINSIIENASLRSAQFEEEVESSSQFMISREMLWRTNIFPVRSSFRKQLEEISIPQFFFREQSQLSIIDGALPLDREELSDGFSLLHADANINISGWAVDMFSLDISEETQNIEYRKISEQTQKLLLEYIDTLSPEKQLRAVADILRKEIWKWDAISDEELTEYITRVLARSPESTLEYIKHSPYNAGAQIREKLQILMDAYREQKFDDMVNRDQIIATDTWRFREQIVTPTTSLPLANSLYEKEGGMNDYEQSFIESISHLSNIVFWHRNEVRSGFVINGWINHYPDFLLYTTSGKIIALETKWGDRDNSDSRSKLKLWKAWENLSHGKCKYFMIFQANPIEGAHTMENIISILQGL